MQPKAGDIILYVVTPRSALSSRLVAIGELLIGKDKGTKRYSHVALWDKPGWQVESVWPWARRDRIDGTRPYEVWRVKDATNEQRKKVMEWTYLHVGQFYDLVYILSFGLIQLRGENVCCTFARGAYAKAGIKLMAARPDQLANSKKLKKILDFKPR